MATVTRAALFSGGDDSLAATLYAFEHDLADVALHIDTTISAPATRAFVEATCRREGWPLVIGRGPKTYRELVLRFGFPGPAWHNIMYRWLKERALASFAREHGGAVTFISGVRKDESARRARTVEAEQKRGRWTWLAPLAEWSKRDVLDYVGARERNPVSATMHMSGDCLCGCYARPGERDEWRLWWPEVDETISALEHDARAAGLAQWRWGVRPASVNRYQLSFDHFACEGCRTG